MIRGLRTVACVALLATAPAFTSAIQPARETLTLGAHDERTLAATETRSYDIQLDAGDFVAATVAPRGIDVAVTLVSPDGHELLDSDVILDTDIAEHVIAVAGVTGHHELRIRAADRDAPAGSYVVTLETVRRATAADVIRADAMRKLEAAARLLKQDQRTSREQGLALAEQSGAAFRSAGDSAGESWAAVTFAWAQDLLLSPKALDASLAATALCRDAGDHDWLSRALHTQGLMRLRNADAVGAQHDLEESLSIAQARDDVMAESRVRNALGIVLGSTGDAERAVQQFTLALENARRIRWRDNEMRILNNLGIATRELGEYKASSDYYAQALPLTRALEDRGSEASVLNNLGNLYRTLRQYPKALEAHEEALVLARQVGNRDHEARALNTLGWTYSALGEFRKALEYFDQSLAIRRVINDPAGLASTLDGAGMACHRLGDDDTALAHLNEALRLQREVAERYEEVDSLAHLATIYRDRGDLDAALSSIRAAVQLADSLRGRLMSPDLRASYVAAEDERYALYVDVLMQLASARSSETFTQQALEASDRGRARVLLESLLEAHAEIREGIEPALLEEERADLRKLDDASTRLSRMIVRQSDAKALESARADVERADAEYQQVEGRIRMNNPKYASLMQPAAITVAEIQRDVLDSNSVLLEFDIGDKRSWLWAVTSSSVDAFELPPRTKIERDGRHLYELLTARQPRDGEAASARAARIAAADSRWRTESAAFSRMILGAAVRTLGARWRGKRLITVADGVLNYLPFSSLPDPLNVSAALVQGHEIVNVPSASVLAVMRKGLERAQRPAKALAVIADPVFEADDPRVQPTVRRASSTATGTDRASQFARLPFSRQEALAISSLVARDDVLRAMDFDANRALVTSGELHDYRFVHFATHGVLDSETPRLSGLMLSLVGRDGRAQDGFLRLNDVYNLSLPADVVVLSACQTALGKEIRGEGLVGLTRGFMYAGARSVVASLWEVDDLATAELMKWFYRGMLKEGLTPAAALRAAQRALARQPQWSSPFYWSAFVIQGEWK